VEFHPKQTHNLFKSACSLVFHEGLNLLGATELVDVFAGTDEGTALQAISLLDITSGLYNNSRVHLIQ
jgi:hypothetical protein